MKKQVYQTPSLQEVTINLSVGICSNFPGGSPGSSQNEPEAAGKPARL